MAPVSQPLPYYRTRGPYGICPDDQIPLYPPVTAPEASKRRPILGRPPVSLTPVPADDEIAKSTVFTQLMSNWDKLTQENYDAGAFDYIKDFNRIIASDEPGPNETLDEATQRKTRDLLNMVHLISLSKPIVCSYEDQNYWESVASPDQENKAPCCQHFFAFTKLHKNVTKISMCI
ncbi:uncharacterized protein LOC131927039 [Physella acuta]|uniref:uncharacterized protein LOC131927039 n=1 Tax=Physella acuta TaxID=109671 RepID=UPI0027DE0A53|nr:uncharacterized protein LOC131927039 [Physella acuta]